MTDLISFIESDWGIKEIKEQRALRENGERGVYLTGTGGGGFVLKIFYSERAGAKAKKDTEVLKFLMRSGFEYAPRIYKALSGEYIAYYKGSPAYLMEYIDGVEMVENAEDGHRLGALLARLHMVRSCPVRSGIDTSGCIADMLARFHQYPFKAEHDSVVLSLPDFNALKQSFIHTDVHPKNAVKRKNGQITLIDFDDAGIGSTYIDLGYPLITQFVQFSRRKEGGAVPDINKLEFHFKEAKAFYDGYFCVSPMGDDEKRHIFDGAVFMQLMYMNSFGDGAVPHMWRILTYALENKPLLLSALGIHP